ncbi:universal stress protein [Defluviimonas sp. WL0002]|uniref:Universal stress protein n=1 Tax=Albidovulum marisflavi TaxID=2984159 RepID=A0ABT2ZBX8_9RHOB|nr:universal stress protein [Defluviimonas sp. WL0002]MCV2868649.1 universal stress protein [Defluviimonas sp. WL0002]
MFSNIMVPVDLRHLERMSKSLQAAADLARLYSARVCYVGVSSAEPSDLGHRPEEVAARLSGFAKAEAAKHGHQGASHLVINHDPTTELDKALNDAVEEVGADLVVMATHIPNVTDYIWASHGGTLALHSPVSVMLVRG